MWKRRKMALRSVADSDCAKCRGFGYVPMPGGHERSAECPCAADKLRALEMAAFDWGI